MAPESVQVGLDAHAAIGIEELLSIGHLGQVVLLKNLPGEVQVIDGPLQEASCMTMVSP